MGWPVGRRKGVRNWGSSPASNNVNINLSRNNELMIRAANPAFTMQLLKKFRPISGLLPVEHDVACRAPGQAVGAPLLAWLIMD